MTRRFSILFVSVVAVLVLAMSASGQEVQITFTNPVNAPNNTDGGVYVGLYQGYINNNRSTPTYFVCDDFLHDISEGQSWNAKSGITNPVSSTVEFSWSNVTNYDLQQWVTGTGTYDGHADLGLTSVLNVQQMYSMITYLADQIFADPTNSSGQWGNLSFAIWSTTDSAWASCEPYCTESEATWGSFSNAYNSTVRNDIYNALTAAVEGTVSGSLNVYTPDPHGAGQEFLSTPEPAAIVLLAWGTLALALAPLVSKLRRKKLVA